MLPSLARKLRLALMLATGIAYVGLTCHDASAKSKKGASEDSDDEGDDDSESTSKDDGGDEADDEDAKDQPPVTAGGLFTLATYPQRENLRPLTMTQKITQLRFGLGTDISNKGAFTSAGLSLEGQYGLQDNFTLRGGFTNAYNLKQFGVYFGFEGSLVYDLFDFRLQGRLNRAAIANVANFCSPPGPSDPMNPTDPMQCTHMSGMPPMVDATIVTQPDGTYGKGPVEFAVDLGFPFRYAAKPEIAIIALDTLMAINFNRKPDLLPSIGVATNPIAALSVVIFAQLRIQSFDFTNQFIIPATAKIEVSPNQKFDIGLQFTFLNLKPPAPQQFYDARFLELFVQARL